MNKHWRATDLRHPCPICGRPNREHQSRWCSVSVDGEVVHCKFVESPMRRGEGWIHNLRNETHSHKSIRTRIQHTSTSTSYGVATNWPVLVEAYQRAVDPDALRILAKSLGLTVRSLQALRIGWDGEAWTFPMSRPDGRFVGIRRRLPTGRKLSVKGGHEALFIPADLNGQDPLFMTEGPTDCAALYDLGLSVFGRPSCRGGVDHCLAMARGRNVVLVPDNDKPGIDGAAELARALLGVARSVRSVIPPVKDAREWLRQGLKREQLT